MQVHLQRSDLPSRKGRAACPVKITPLVQLTSDPMKVTCRVCKAKGLSRTIPRGIGHWLGPNNPRTT